MRTLLIFAAATIFWIPTGLRAQVANPTQAVFVPNQYAQNLTARTGVRVQGRATPQIIIAMHNLFMSTGFGAATPGTVDLSTVNAYTDSLALMTSWIDANVDASLFVNGTDATVTNTLLPAMQHAAGITGMRVKLNWSLSTGNGVNPGGFAKAACNASLIGGNHCDTTNAPCSVSTPCIANVGNTGFADFQAYALGVSGPMQAMLASYGAPTALGTHLAGFSVFHEPANLSNSALNPNWNGSTNGQGSPTDWAGFATAAVTLIRGIAAATCTNCPSSATAPAELSAAMVIPGADTAFFPVICTAASTLTACGVDFYPTPTSSVPTSFLTLQTTVANQCATAGKPCFIQETVPGPGWTPGSSPQSDGLAYRGALHRDWDLYRTQIDWMKTLALVASAMGFTRVTVFNSGPALQYAVQPSCPNFPQQPGSCSAPVPTCGNNNPATQCGGDIMTGQPAIANMAVYLKANGTSITPLGQFIARLNSAGWMYGAQ